MKDHSKDYSNQTPALAIEDYNTTGLVGSFDKDEENSTSNLVNFWWNSGHGNKGKGTLGNAGVGKITFTAASGMRTMWAVSKRLNEKLEPKVLLGYTDLPYHHVKGQSYLGYARYGIEEELPSGEKVLNPIVEQQSIDLFESAFGIDRNVPGLSIIIPAISDEFSPPAIILAILEHYFWAIINKKLIVDVVSDEGATTTLDAAHIAKALEEHVPMSDELHKRVEYAAASHILFHSNKPTIFKGLEPVRDDAGRKLIFTKNQLTDENLDAIRGHYEAGEMIMAEFVVPFNDLKENKEKKGLINIFFQKLDRKKIDLKDFFILFISLTRMASARKKSSKKCFLLCDDPRQ